MGTATQGPAQPERGLRDQDVLEHSDEYEDSIAIVGMSGRFPGADSTAELWNLLLAGKEAIVPVTDAELRSAGAEPAAMADPNYVKRCARVAGIDLFDASFFGYTGQQATELDPQHRLFLECAWHALEDAGCSPDKFAGPIGVFAGAGASLYSSRSGAAADFPTFYSRAISSGPDFLATRVSYKMNLSGPSVTVQTACSTSLVAVHLACQSLLTFESDLALAGGTSLQIPHGVGYFWNEGGIASRDGHCRAFDRSATGTVPGSGAAIVALRRYSDAIRDGNHIYAIIKSTAINNDGSEKVGYTAPGVAGQAHVISLAQAGTDPTTIGMLEAHGTGTALGDSAELAALLWVFGRHSAEPFCALGSIKTNIGHLDCAAGVTGLIKAALCLKYRYLVPSLHFEQPHPELAGSPFYVPGEARPWDQRAWPRRAGVSSFGIGGTNAHALLEEAPQQTEPPSHGGLQVFPVSAKSASALSTLLGQLARHVRERGELSLEDVARTLQQGRTEFEFRAAFITGERETLLRLLESASGSATVAHRAVKDRPVTLHLGNGSSESILLVCRLRAAYERLAVEVEQCIACAPAARRLELTSWLEEATQKPHIDMSSPLAAAMTFVSQYCLAKVLISWLPGVNAVTGEGVGDYSAACLAGELPVEGALEDLCRPAVPMDSKRTRTLPRTRATSATEHVIKLARVHSPGSVLLVLDAASRLGSSVASMGDRVELAGATSDDAREPLLRALAAAWQLGAKLEWAAVCRNADSRLVPLPGYPFERQRFWADPVMQARVDTPAVNRVERLPKESWYSVPAWRAVNFAATSRAGIAAASPWLIVGCGNPIEAAIGAHLRASGGIVVRIEPGTRYERLGPDRFCADARDPDHLRQILEALQYEGIRPRSIIHCGGLAVEAAGREDDIFWRAQERGFLSVLFLLREMQKLYPVAELSVVALTSESSCAPTDRIVRPEHATLVALGAVLVQEVPGCKLTIVDLAGVPREDIEGRSDLSDLYADWTAGEAVGGCREPLVAYRLGQRLVREFARTPLSSGGPPRGIKRDGVYVIAGGLGRVGLALAEHLTGSYGARLVLITRKVLPEERHWSSTLADPSCPRELADCLRRLVAIRHQTAHLMIASSDLSDEAGVRNVLDAAERRFGRLNGVFHLAADLAHASAQKPLEELTRADLQAQCRAKVQGFHCLRRVLEEKPVDFAVVFSSNSAILGGAGLAAYAAANAYVNAAVTKEWAKQPQRWRAFSWDGLVEDAGLSSAAAHICLRDAVDVTCQLLDHSADPLIIVSALDLATRLRALREARVAKRAAEAPVSTREPRPRLATPYVAPRSDMEARLVELWEETLAIAGIGVEDDLFDLNGDSLNAMSILSRVEELFGVEVPLRKFMSGKTTVTRLSTEIRALLEKGPRSRLPHERALAGRA